jgi:hypothetical protein
MDHIVVWQSGFEGSLFEPRRLQHCLNCPAVLPDKIGGLGVRVSLHILNYKVFRSYTFVSQVVFDRFS